MMKSEMIFLETYSKNKNKLIELFNRIKLIKSEINSNIPNQTIDIITENFKNDIFKIAVMGEQKRGKSTLINAILSDKILPDGVIPVSNTITEVKNAPQEKIEVIFNDKPPKYIKKEEIRSYSDEKHNPGNTKNVKKIRVEYPCKVLGDTVTLVDTPGQNSIHQYHTQIIYEYIPEATAVIFLITADNPISLSEKTFIEKIAESSNIKKFFFIISKKDLLSNSDINDIICFNKEVLSKMKGIAQNDLKFITVSSKFYLEGLVTNDEYMIINSNVPEFKNILEKFIIDERALLILKAYKDALDNHIMQLKSEQETLLKVALTDKGELDKEKVKYEEKKKEYEKRLNDAIEEYSEAIELAKRRIKKDGNNIKRISKEFIISEIKDISVFRPSDLEQKAKEMPSNIESKIIDFFTESLDKIKVEYINPGLEKLKNKIDRIKEDFESDLIPINNVKIGIDIENKVGALAIGEAISGIAVFLGYSLVKDVGIIFTSPVALFPWLIPIGIASAVAIAGYSLYNLIISFKENKSQLENELINRSAEMIDNAIESINENFEKNKIELSKFLKNSLEIDIESVINSIDKIKEMESEKDLKSLIDKTSSYVKSLDALKSDICKINNI